MAIRNSQLPTVYDPAYCWLGYSRQPGYLSLGETAANEGINEFGGHSRTIAFAIGSDKRIDSSLELTINDDLGDDANMTPSEKRIAILRMLVDQELSTAAFARKHDLDATYLRQLLSGHRSFGEKAAAKMGETIAHNARLFDMDPEDPKVIVSLVDTKKAGQALASITRLYESQDLAPAHQGINRVPLIASTQAGGWREIVDNSHHHGVEEWVETTVPVRAHTYALRVDGDSMTPTFPPGSVIIVEPELEARPGDFVVVRLNGDSTFKQLTQDAGVLYLRPLNDRYPIRPMPDGSEICGVVRAVTQTFR